MPVAREKAIAFERHKHRAAEDKNVPDGHIIPLLPPLSFPVSLLKQLTPAPWPSLCSWPWETELNLILRVKPCPLKAAPGLFCAPREGSQHPTPAQPDQLLFPASSLQAKAQLGRNSTVTIVCGFICTEGKVCCALPPCLVKTR